VDYLIGGFFAREDLSRNDRFVVGADSEFYQSTVFLANLVGLYNTFPGVTPLTPAAQANGQLFLSQATGRAPGTSIVSGEGLRDRYEQETTSAALFTHNIVELSDQVDLTLGLRYTTERSPSSRGSPTATARPVARLDRQSRTHRRSAYRARLQPDRLRSRRPARRRADPDGDGAELPTLQ
jgi:outer membrane receptor protein involved in Fe transport